MSRHNDNDLLMAAPHFGKELSANGIIHPHSSRLSGLREQRRLRMEPCRSTWSAARRGPRYAYWARPCRPLAVERLTYQALLASLQALLAEDLEGALTIAAEMAFIALLRQSDYPDDPGLQRLRRHAVQLLNQVRGELTLHEQLLVPPLM